jgi:hypothetical protein
VIPKPAARISSDPRHGSFFPFSRSEMNALPNPVCTARYVCVQPRFSRSSRIRLPNRAQTSVATGTAWLYSLGYISPIEYRPGCDLLEWTHRTACAILRVKVWTQATCT